MQGRKLTANVDIQLEVTSFYQDFLGSPATTSLAVDSVLFRQGPVLSHSHGAGLVALSRRRKFMMHYKLLVMIRHPRLMVFRQSSSRVLERSLEMIFVQ